MASKKKARRGRGLGGASASEFIRSLPRDQPAKEVVLAGAKKGLEFSANLVYAVRASAAKRAGSSKRGRKPARGRGGASSNLEGALRNAIALLGLTRSREILQEVEAAFSGR
ncbi:MAG TPA: hypothetical protein VGP93_05465 [Polyangiaceae bacterium]|nr:hypothetical protein [Polyangiaceae bacterium]